MEDVFESVNKGGKTTHSVGAIGPYDNLTLYNSKNPNHKLKFIILNFNLP